MRLAEFRVFGLFGIFDHIIPFNLDERITIVHAPNGYGKTVVLKLIRAMFGGSLSAFRDVEFDSLEYLLDDGRRIIVEKIGEQPELFVDASPRPGRNYQIIVPGSPEQLTWSPNERSPLKGLLSPSDTMSSDRDDLLRSILIGDVRYKSERAFNIERYIDRYEARHISPHPEWLEQLRSSIDCRLIDTQRLMSFGKKQGSSIQNESTMTLAVQSYSAELKASIERILAESATLSQSLDQTFPNRLLGRMSKPIGDVGEVELRKLLSALEAQRARLARAGLLDSAKDETIISNSQLDDPTLRILNAYAEDTDKKLSFYDDILEKIELFLEVINGRFRFKSISIDRNEGFQFRDVKGRRIEPQNLSSGEQHELVLIYDLLFRSRENTLVLIDEPEISLHIAWQKRFLGDLRRIIDITRIDAVVSTHSPQLIGPDLDLTVQLQAPDGLLDRE